MNLWEATTRLFPPEAPTLEGAMRADVAVVGAGYTGLSAALALAERGACVVVLEGRQIGYGASGRNGGQVIPGLKLDPDALDRRFGEATTAFVGAAADTTFALIERLKIDCGAARTGWIQPTVKRSHRKLLARRAEQWRRRGAPVETLDMDAVQRKTGSIRFHAGLRYARAGVLHPLDYVRGLARAAEAAGAKLHALSPVERLVRTGPGWRVTTAHGSVEASDIVLAANGYTDGLWPGLKQTIMPARSCQIATTPLDPELLAQILPGGEAVSDTRRIGVYFRIGPGGRLVIGGRGPFREPRAPHDYRRLKAALTWLFPAPAEFEIEHYWSGRVAMTADHLPHVHQPAPGVVAALGYNGRGVAMATALGLAIGAHVADRSQPLPLEASRMAPLPVHGLHPVYGEWAIAFSRLRDALEL